MTPEQIHLIPNHLLADRDTCPLLEYLAARGQRLTLLELDDERRRRFLKPPSRTKEHI